MVKTKKGTIKPLAYAGIIFGVLSFYVPLAPVLGTFAIATGAIARTRAKKGERILCNIAVILGIMGWALFLILLILLGATVR